jgi:tubulin-folding cofactor B
VALNVTHSNLRQLVQELRFDLHSSIADVKQRLYTFNGSQTGSMELHLKDGSGNLLARMLDEGRPLGYYGAATGMRVHVVDTDPTSMARDGGLDDVSRIAKYRMSDADYDAREGTLRAYKKKMLAENPNFRFVPAAPAAAAAGVPEDYLEPDCVAGAAAGQRCEVAPRARRGTIRWVGDSYPAGVPGLMDATAAITLGHCNTVLVVGGQARTRVPGSVIAYTRPDNEFTGSYGSSKCTCSFTTSL